MCVYMLPWKKVWGDTASTKTQTKALKCDTASSCMDAWVSYYLRKCKGKVSWNCRVGRDPSVHLV